MDDNLENRTLISEKMVSKLSENGFQEDIENIILNYCPNLEYEVRYFFKNPKNHLNIENYNRIKYILDSNKPPLVKIEEFYINKSKNIDKYSKIRCKFDENENLTEDCIVKTKLSNEDEKIGNHGIRISISNETKLLESNRDSESYERTRIIERTSYVLGEYRYDISEVNSERTITYEFEIEYIGSDIPVNINKLKDKMKLFITYLTFGKLKIT
jgi:hypothetical protein